MARKVLKVVDHVGEAGIFLENSHRAQKMNGHASSSHSCASTSKWLTPPIEAWRLDVDACVNEGDGRYGIGGVVRNCDGLPLFSFGRRLECQKPVIERELIAMKNGQEVVIKKIPSSILVSSDSLVAMQAVIDVKETWGHVGTWANEISYLLEKIPSVSLLHVWRSANSVAQSSASFCRSFLIPICLGK